MSLEDRIEALTKAIERNIDIMIGINKGEYLLPQAKPADEKPAEKKAEEVPNAPFVSATSKSSTASAPTGESSSRELTYAGDVKPATLRLSKEKGRETAVEVLQRFGVKGAQELDKTQWADYIAHCEKVLAGGDV